MKCLRVELGDNSYNIFIQNDIIKEANRYIKEVYNNKKIYIITDTNVGPLYAEGLKKSLFDYETQIVTVQAGEKSKSFDTYVSVLEKLIDLDIRRNELLIALGGGVVGDLCGFVASTIYRGIPFVQIPTSLLSQMDSSIGGKTGIDFYNKKNIVGAFKQPKLVLIDPKTLDTLPEVEYKSGMGELIKHSLIGNTNLFEELKKCPKIDENIIAQSLMVKKKLVEIDQFDQNERMYLNFGHTFGHIIEMELNLKHGHAVALGMLMALQFGIDLHVTKPNLLAELKAILDIYGIDYQMLDYHTYLKKTIYDKKNLAGKIKFILLEDIGKVIVKEFDEGEIRNGCKA